MSTTTANTSNRRTVAGFNIKSFLVAWFFVLAGVVITAAAGLGYSGIDNSIDWGQGFETFWGFFIGGLPALIIVLVAVAIFGLVFWVVFHIGKTNYTSKKPLVLYAIILIAVLILVALVGFDWIQIDLDTMLPSIGLFAGLIVLVTVITAAAQWNTKIPKEAR